MKNWIIIVNIIIESTLKSPNMSRAKAQPLPSLVGEGLGWGQYLIRYQDITDPTPPKGHPSP